MKTAALLVLISGAVMWFVPPLILEAIGFGPLGPEPKSLASYIQSYIGNVEKNSLFSGGKYFSKNTINLKKKYFNACNFYSSSTFWYGWNRYWFKGHPFFIWSSGGSNCEQARNSFKT